MAGVSRMGRLLATGLAGALLLAACASRQHNPRAGAASPTGTPTGALVVKTFAPYAATGTLEVPVADQLSGSCWTGSIAVPKAGSYRCLSGNVILDPCFAPARQSDPPTVACVADPWSQAHILTLTGALPTAAPLSARHTPWALELANAAHCVAGTGTVPLVDGVALSYRCGDGMAAGLLGTGTGTGGAHLSVRYGSVSGSTLATVAVTTAWEG